MFMEQHLTPFPVQEQTKHLLSPDLVLCQIMQLAERHGIAKDPISRLS